MDMLPQAPQRFRPSRRPSSSSVHSLPSAVAQNCYCKECHPEGTMPLRNRHMTRHGERKAGSVLPRCMLPKVGLPQPFWTVGVFLFVCFDRRLLPYTHNWLPSASSLHRELRVKGPTLSGDHLPPQIQPANRIEKQTNKTTAHLLL